MHVLLSISFSLWSMEPSSHLLTPNTNLNLLACLPTSPASPASSTELYRPPLIRSHPLHKLTVPSRSWAPLSPQHMQNSLLQL